MQKKEQLNTYMDFFDEFSKWRSKDAGMALDYAILIDVSGSMASGIKIAGELPSDNWSQEEIHDFMHICGSMSDQPKRIDLAKLAGWMLIDRVHEETRQDSCILSIFADKVDSQKKTTAKSLLQRRICQIQVSKNQPTRLWASIRDILNDLPASDKNPLKLQHVIVFTDGCDNYSGDSSEFSKIENDPNYRDERNAQLASEFVIQAFNNMKERGIRNPPRLKIVAVDPNGNFQSLWDRITPVLTDQIYPFPVIQVEVHLKMSSVVQGFLQEAQRMKERLARVGTIENLIWTFLGIEAPKPRFFVYPGAVLSTLVSTGRITESSISHQDLRQSIYEFIGSTSQQEAYSPIGPELETVKRQTSSVIDDKRYRAFVADDRTISVLTDIVIDCAQKAGWIIEQDKNYELTIEDFSPAFILVREFFLNGAWKHGREKLKELMPRIKAACEERQVDFPLITTKDILAKLDEEN